MSADAVRVGTAVIPTQIQAGTDNSETAPRQVRFTPYARPVLVSNRTGGGRVIRVKINNLTDFDNDSDDDGPGHLTIPDAAAPVDISQGGLVNVETVAFITTNAADDLDNVDVVGWQP